MKVTITTGAADKRMAKPADLVALVTGMSTADARAFLDKVAAVAEGRNGLRYPPWRQVYSLRLSGTDYTEMELYSKPVESAAITDLDGVAVDTTGYRTIGNSVGILDRVERAAGWNRNFSGSIGISGTPDPDSETDAWIAAVTAGWIMPGQVGDWTASTAYKAEVATTSRDDPATAVPYVVGSWVRATDPRVILRFECTTTGTTDATEPTEFTAAATVAGTTITDGTATWTARAALELPDDLSGDALRYALWLYENQAQTRQAKVQETGKGKERVEWMTASEAAPPIPTPIAATFEAYR